MKSERFEVIITLHTGSESKFIYDDTKERVEDIVSKMWYEGFLETNPLNPKRRIHILPEKIKSIQIKLIER
jgi:hypothetical protein